MLVVLLEWVLDEAHWKPPALDSTGRNKKQEVTL